MPQLFSKSLTKGI